MSLSLDNLTCNCNHGETDKEKYELIGQMIDAYKDKEGSLIMVLHAAQEIYGYLPLELQKFIALRMNKPLSEVNGVVSFYSFFSTKERGEHTIHVCMGTACYVKGSQQVLDKLAEVLEIEPGRTTKDGLFTLNATRCLGACGLAPVIMVNDDVYGRLTPDQIPAIIEKYRA